MPHSAGLLIDWRRQNATFFGALQVERNVMFIILNLIVLVAAAEHLSALTNAGQGQDPEHRNLRTMGVSQGCGDAHILMTGTAIGAIGTLTGFAVGTVFCANIRKTAPVPLSWLTSTDCLTRTCISSRACPPKWMWAKPPPLWCWH